MKTFKILSLLIAIAALISCDKEEIAMPELNLIPTDSLMKVNDNDLTLTFSVQTEEDQMGAFAENAITFFHDKIWSAGGVNDYDNSDLHFLWNSENGINWSTVPITGTPENFMDFRIGHTLTTFNDQLYLIGGKDNLGEGYNNIWKSSDGQSWTESIAPFGSIPEHSTLILDNTMYVITGNAVSGNTEVWSTTDGDSWDLETSNALPGRAGHKGVVFNNTMFILGGEDRSGNKLNEIWSSTDGINWSQITTSTIFSARNSNTTTVHDNKVWIVGGVTDSGFTLDLWYSENMTDWFEYTGSLPTTEGLSKHSALSYDGELWLFGGYQNEASGITRIGSIRSINVN